MTEAFIEALLEDDAEELYDNAPCAYLSTRPDGTIVKANATFLRWTGYERDAIVGRRRFQELLPPGDRIFYETHFGPALRMQGQVREIAIEILCVDGSRLPVLVNSVLTTDASTGAAVAIRTALFDATERRAYERELLDARRRAEASEARATALARTLQSTFLPPALVAIPGIELGAGYRPSGDGSEVGGDFYDAFAIDGSTWGVVLGDVCGKGAAAAVVTALARYTVRAEALRTGAPSEVLLRLHDVLLREHPDQFCTAALLRVSRSPSDGSYGAVIASGGHPLPVRSRGDRTGLDSVGAPGSMIGMLPEAHVTDVAFDLAPGDVLVLYTDGITEARRDGEFFGDERVARLVADAGDVTAQELADALVSTAVEFQGGTTRDDIAVLVLRVLDAEA